MCKLNFANPNLFRIFVIHNKGYILVYTIITLSDFSIFCLDS